MLMEQIEALFTASVDNDSPETSFDSDVVQASPKKRMRLDNSSSPLARARTVISKDEQNEDHGLEHVCPGRE